MNARRELAVVVACCALGAVVVLVAGGREWASWLVDRPEPLAPVPESRTGGDLAPAAGALGLAALAGAVALVATRGWGRLLTGVLLVALGAGVVPQSSGLDVPARADVTVWPVLSAVGGVVIGVAGVAAILRGRRWTALSRRYQAPAQTRQTAEPDLWAAIERGDDPTAER